MASLTQAQPLLPGQLQLRVTINLGTDLGIGGNSTFNPRFFDGFDYVNQINTQQGFGRYPSGSSTPALVVNNQSIIEHRMVTPFRGALSSTYMLGSGSGTLTTTLSRYDFDGSNRVDVNTPDLQTAEGFDWVDDDTLIYTDYTSGNRKRLYLVDVVAQPFSLAVNTAWNANGYITTSVGTAFAMCARAMFTAATLITEMPARTAIQTFTPSISPRVSRRCWATRAP